MVDDHLQVNGRKLYVRTYGLKRLPPLLYLHGGPGAGSYDFEIHLAYRLSKFAHVIVIDQRGVLRSEELSKEDGISVNEILQDCESLREQLKIDNWHILSSGFGGFLALKYADLFPNSIKTLIFENPTFDLKLSALSLLSELQDIYLENGNIEEANKCAAVESKNLNTKELLDELCQLLGNAGLLRNHLYVHGADKNFFEELVIHSTLPKAWWQRTKLFQTKLFQDPIVFESLLPLLKILKVPSLLLKGKYDVVFDEVQLKEYLSQVGKGKLITFDKSSHFIRYEQTDEYEKAIKEFITFHEFI